MRTKSRLTDEQRTAMYAASLKSGRLIRTRSGYIKCTVCGHVTGGSAVYAEDCMLGHPWVCGVGDCDRVFRNKQAVTKHRWHHFHPARKPAHRTSPYVYICGGDMRPGPRDSCPHELHNWPLPAGYVDAHEAAKSRLGRRWSQARCPFCGLYGWRPGKLGPDDVEVLHPLL